MLLLFCVTINSKIIGNGFFRRTELLASLHIAPEEINRWKEITKKMTVHISDEGIIEQFQGFFKLKVTSHT